jgi:hypothetical protein
MQKWTRNVWVKFHKGESQFELLAFLCVCIKRDKLGKTLSKHAFRFNWFLDYLKVLSVAQKT